MASDEKIEYEFSVQRKRNLGLNKPHGLNMEECSLSVCSTDCYDYLLDLQLENEKVMEASEANKRWGEQEEMVNHAKKNLRKKLCSDFSILRSKMMKMYSDFERTFLPTEGKLIPDISNQKAWCKFCLGKELFSKIQDSGDSDAFDCDPGGKLPLLCFTFLLTDEEVQKLLSYHNVWLQQLGFSYRQGIWIQALLVKLKKPLSKSTAAMLNDLKETCDKLRKDLAEEDGFAEYLRYIIDVLRFYFEIGKILRDFKRERIGITYWRW